MPLAKLLVTAHPRTPFRVVYTDPTRREKSGRAKRVSAWFVDEAKAEGYCRELNAVLAVEGAEGVQFGALARSDYHAAVQILRAAGWEMPLAEIAREFVARKPRRLAADVAVSGLLDDWLEHKRRAEARAERTVGDLEKRVGLWCKLSGVSTVGQIDEAAVECLLSRRVSARTRWNDITAVSGFLAWLVGKGLLASNPLESAARPSWGKHAPTIWLPVEAARMMRAAERYRGGYWVPTMVLLLFAGLRPSELADSRVILEGEPCVRAEGGKMKGRANRIVPLSANAVAWLRTYPPQDDGRVEPLTARARVTLRDLARVRWHMDTPRHTFISNRIAVLPDEGAVARESGNTPDIIFRHYHRLVSQTAAAAFWAIAPEVKAPARSE